MARALPDLIARIRLDSSGLDEAVSNLTGSFGKANLAMAGVAAGLGLIVVGTKSVIDIGEEHEKANRDLKQAVDATGGSLDVVNSIVDNYISTNQRFLKSQSEATEGFAVLTRSGLQRNEVTRAMNIALDLSALKHISLSEAVDLVNKAEHGRFKGLVDLGIVSKDQIDANGNLITGTHGIAHAMDDLEAKTAHGRDTTKDLDRETNILKGHWEDISAKTAPVLIQGLVDIEKGANHIYDALDKIGKDDALWKRINDRLVTVAQHAKEASDWLGNIGGTSSPQTDFWNWLMNGPIGSAGGRRAAGGPVLPNSVYTVGESGPETLVMGAQGGTVIPNSGQGGGGSTINLTMHVHGSVQTERDLLVSMSEGLRRLDREKR